MKTKISLQCPSLLVFFSFLIYYIEKEVKWEAQMGTGCLPVEYIFKPLTMAWISELRYEKLYSHG